MKHSNKFSCWLPGEPVPQARPKVTRRGHVYYPAKSAAYRKRIAGLLKLGRKGRETMPGPLKVYLTFCRTRPKSNKSKWPTVKPDIDNLAKQVIDALMDAGVIYDDGQICELHCTKDWSDNPGVYVETLTKEA